MPVSGDLFVDFNDSAGGHLNLCIIEGCYIVDNSRKKCGNIGKCAMPVARRNNKFNNPVQVLVVAS